VGQDVIHFILSTSKPLSSAITFPNSLPKSYISYLASQMDKSCQSCPVLLITFCQFWELGFSETSSPYGVVVEFAKDKNLSEIHKPLLLKSRHYIHSTPQQNSSVTVAGKCCIFKDFCQ
jgi:hypothetical protein